MHDHKPAPDAERSILLLATAAFVSGAFLGLLVLLPTLFRLRRERIKLRRELDGMIDANTTSPTHG